MPAQPTLDAIPALEPGLTVLETPTSRTAALHAVVLAHLAEADGPAVWIDARGNAAPRLLRREGRPTPDVRVARAFTAYQHYELIRRLPADCTAGTALVVCPCLPALYADPDLPGWAGEGYHAAALAVLGELASAAALPILATATADADHGDAVHAAADRTLTVEPTDVGFRYAGEGFETTGYWAAGGWQTTIPYWVELCGAVGAGPPAPAATVAPARGVV